MNTQYLTLDEDSPAVLKGCLWALGTGTTLVVFLMLIWLAVQRAEIQTERYHCRAAESECDAARVELNQTIQSYNQRIGQEQSARFAAENQAQLALQAKAQAEAEFAQAKAQRDQDERVVTYLRAALARSRY